ncbi:MAG: NAD(+)/NADH kinase [Deltaproteobacteria bacterium]|nr:NAD(+)/NADH kinase [Deltaproteobacteria bacterium]
MRVGLMVKRTAWDLHRIRKKGRVRELLAHRDPTVANILPAHEEHVATLMDIKRVLAEAGVEVVTLRRKTFDDRDLDLVVTVGGDGTMLRASHSVRRAPILAINSAPSYSVGFFCGATCATATEALRKALEGKLRGVVLTRMQVRLNGKVVSSRVLNDALFCHKSPAATARYIVEHRGVVEEQKSSGFWIGPAAGSTAAQRSAGGKVLPLTSTDLQLVVREPYTPRGQGYRLTRLIVKPGEPVTIRSKSREMRIFLDGPDQLVRAVLGDVVVFEQSAEPLEVLGLTARRC